MTNPTGPRLLIIGLDGFDITYAGALMDSGEMPALNALRNRSAGFLLDHGSAQRIGLAWEHVASGLAPSDAHRWSAIEFDPSTYEIWQEGARFDTFLDFLDGKVVVFDNPYTDLSRSSHVEGIVGWGGHDPGTGLQSRPVGLLEEFRAKFGLYGWQEWVYACPAYSADACRNMGDALVEALRVRQKGALWLMNERFPDADVFFAVTGELHSAFEGLWHGVDPGHPMHSHPSAGEAGAAILKIHRAIDRFVAALVEAAGDCQVVVFSMGGMGPNVSDLQSMILLPELLYRNEFGRSFLRVPDAWSADLQAISPVPTNGRWDVVKDCYPNQRPPSKRSDARFAGLGRRLIRKFLPAGQPAPDARENRVSWQPTTFYREYWPQMRAFALPSYYDGRIRINLAQREAQGKVAVEDYEATCTELTNLLDACRDARTGESIVADIERPRIAHPLDLDSSDADMTIVWKGTSNGFKHPDHGLIGPVPYRRTGGHTGPHGVAYFAQTPLPLGYHGVTSSFDVAPTIAELVNGSRDIPVPLSGESLLARTLRTT